MKKSAFTLVEMIVGITISILLMTSIWVFVSSWMSNITLQKKVLDDNKQTSSDMLYLQKKIQNSKQIISNIWTNTWILLRQNKDFDEGWFSYIWVTEFDKAYCGSWEITKTNHVYISNFIPLNGVSTGSLNYKSDTQNHQILKKSDNSVIVWKDIFWDKFVEGTIWTWVFLNSPTGLIEVGWKLIFSDTLNDRILYLSGSHAYWLLDEKDWLNEPTWLAYNLWDKALYIANSWKGEVLKLSSLSGAINPDLRLQNISKDNISKLKIEIFNTTEILTGPIWSSNFSFSGSVQNVDDFVYLENNKINYYFIDSYNSESSQSDCNGSNNWKIVNASEQIIDCISSGTGKLASLKSTNLVSDNITITWIAPLLWENKSYYVQLFWKYYPYFTQWDNNIFTKEDNVLEVIQTWLVYPTWINNSWVASEFDTASFNPNNYEPDFVFSNPIKKLEKNYSSGLLNIKLDYYKYLNCFNPDEKVEKTYLFKKNFN